MDNLSVIEQYTAMNGLGAGEAELRVIDPRYRAEEEPLDAPSYTPSSALRRSPAPSIYSWQAFRPTWTQQGEDISAPGYYEDPASTSVAAGGTGPVPMTESGAVAAKNIATNSSNVFTPQAGTVGADPNKLSVANVVNALLGVTGAGVTEYQRQKLAATLVAAQKKKQPVYLPPQVVQKSQTPWGWIAGAGAVLAVGVALYFVLRKKG